MLGPSDSGPAAGRPDTNSLGIARPAADLRTAVTPSVDAPRSYPALAVASPTVRVSLRSVPRRRLAAIFGAVALAVLAVGGYYAYREHPVPDVPAASGAVKGGGSPIATGAPVDPPASADATAPAASTPALAVTPRAAGNDKRVAIRPGTGVSGDATAPLARSGATETSPRRPGAEAKAPSEPAAPVPAAVARPRSAGASPGIIERPPRVGPCTDAVAALGLCTSEAIQRRE